MKLLQKLNTRQKIQLSLLGILYPAVVILPYFSLHTTDTRCGVDCVSMGAASPVFSIVAGLLFVMGVSLAILLPRAKSHRLNLEYLKARVLLGLVSIAFWTPIYVYMRRHSQGASTIVYSNVNGEFVKVFNPKYGWGVSPSTLVLISLAYVVPPMLMWWMCTKSKSRVVGIKKTELFS